MQTKSKNIFGNICLLITTTTVLIVIIEISFRLYYPNRYYFPDFLYMFKSAYGLEVDLTPNLTGYIWNKKVRINSLSFRGREYDIEKENKVKRICALGDSFTFGYGASDTETYPYIMEQLLNSNNKVYEVLNFGIYGYNATDYPDVLRKKVMLFKPDIVILQTWLNDCVQSKAIEKDVVSNVNKVRTTQTLRDSYLYLKQRSLFLKYLDPKIKHMLYNLLKKMGINKELIIAENIRALDEYKYNKQGWRGMKEALLNCKVLCRENNIDFYVIIFPVMARLNDAYAFKDYHVAVKEFCIENNINVLDLYDVLKGRDLTRYRVNIFDAHANYEGNKLFAQAIVNYLNSMPRNNTPI